LFVDGIEGLRRLPGQRIGADALGIDTGGLQFGCQMGQRGGRDIQRGDLEAAPRQFECFVAMAAAGDQDAAGLQFVIVQPAQQRGADGAAIPGDGLGAVFSSQWLTIKDSFGVAYCQGLLSQGL
jgi:hypothetical protein